MSSRTRIIEAADDFCRLAPQSAKEALFEILDIELAEAQRIMEIVIGEMGLYKEQGRIALIRKLKKLLTQQTT